MSELNEQQKKNKPVERKKIINWRILMIVFVLVLYFVTNLVLALMDAKPTVGVLTYSEMMDMIDEGKVDYISVVKGEASAVLHATDGQSYDIVNSQSDTFIEDIMKRGGKISYQKSKLSDSIMGILLQLPVMLVMAMFVIYLSTTIMGANTKIFTLVKSKNNHTYFKDIRGISETKEEVKFLVDRVTDWKQLGKMGARPVKGVLFYGPPGTGKTLLAKAIAKEANVPFISASGSDFNEVFVGTGARRVRDLWDLAACNAPCILFIDEIDCLGKRRRGGGEAQENNQTINALLQRMDGLNSMPGVLVIGATNRKEDLDPALLRSGRFDREFFIGPPSNKKDRDDVVSLYLDNKILGADVNVEKASKLLTGMSAADIDETLSEAVYVSLMHGREGIIDLCDIDEAAMKIMTGAVVKEHTSERDKKVTAIHEAGHALISLLHDLPVSKVSIIAYSNGVGGVTIQDTDETQDIKLKTKTEFEKQLMILLAGKCAEEVINGEHTQGCSNDLEKATKLVYELLVSYGYDEDTLVNEDTLRDMGVQRLVSDETVDMCNRYLSDLNDETMKMLKDNKKLLEALYKELLDKKTIVNPTLENIRGLVDIH